MQEVLKAESHMAKGGCTGSGENLGALRQTTTMSKTTLSFSLCSIVQKAGESNAFGTDTDSHLGFALYLLSESFRRHFNSQLCCGRKSYGERSTSYLLSSSAVRMTSLKSNAKNVVTNSVLLNGHSVKQEMAL